MCKEAKSEGVKGPQVKVTAEELRQRVQPKYELLLQKMETAMNAARPGAIIADSEEIVRDAMAVFRQQVYEAAVQMKAEKAAHAAFSPSEPSADGPAASQQGRPKRHPSDGQRDH